MKEEANKVIRVSLVEDHAGIRQGLSYIINSSDGLACLTYSSAEEGLQHITSENTDVVLMDINLPGMSGIECTRIVKERFPSIPVMMCTAYEDDESIFMALAAGAKGYILKRAAGDKLIEAIRDLNAGGSPMSSTIARRVVESFQDRRSEVNTEYHLTEREKEILDLVAKGLRNKEIAAHLFLSAHTIRTHIYNIYEKLHVQSRVEALNKIGKRMAP